MNLIQHLIAARHDMPADWASLQRSPHQRPCPDAPWMPGMIGIRLALQREIIIPMPIPMPIPLRNPRRARSARHDSNQALLFAA